MKKLYKKIIRFFTTQQTTPFEVTLLRKLYKDAPKPLEFTKQQEKRIKQFIRLEVRKQLNKKK